VTLTALRKRWATGIPANARQVVLTESFHEQVRCRGGYQARIVRKLQTRPHGKPDGSDSNDRRLAPVGLGKNCCDYRVQSDKRRDPLAQECTNRGQLDALYCDENNDLVADVPTDPKKLRDPSTLAFAHTPVEHPSVYQTVFKPFTDFLAQCTGKPFVYYPVQSNSAEIEAMRSGGLHAAGFSTGPTGFAVNLAGAIPFAAMGTEKGPQGYHLLSIVKKDSPYQKLADLKGKRVAHTSPSSNSGHLAPLVLYPPEGLRPNEDYEPLMSGGHDKSALGVASGAYDMAGVASDVFERMLARGTLKADDFRIIFTSPIFPTSSFAYAHDLQPDLARKIRACFFAFDFPPSMRKEFNGADRFFPITYKDAWKVVREIANASGTAYNKETFEVEAKREAEALAKTR
jgi:phosphonate transport system substrate-binding protein